MESECGRVHSVLGFESHLAHRGMLLHIVQLLLELSSHLIPHVDEAHLYHLEFLLPL